MRTLNMEGLEQLASVNIERAETKMSGKISNIFFFSIIVSRSHTAPKPQAKLRKIFGLRMVKKLMETFMR